MPSPHAGNSHSNPSSGALPVGGFVSLSTVDWPDQLAAVVFTRGCPWRCAYCHNAHLNRTDADRSSDPSWVDVASFLETRKGLLDGVVFSGGEPTLHRSLPAAMREVRRLGLRVGLHSGGGRPERFGEALALVDWVGFDVKAPFAHYERVTGVPGSGELALESLRALVASGIPFEARTTVHHDLLDAAALTDMAAELLREGVREWVIQPYRPTGVEPGLLGAVGFHDALVPDGLGSGFERFSVRR